MDNDADKYAAEVQVAERVEQLMARHLDIECGPRTRRDGSDSSGLTVDFTYEGAQPQPIALEVFNPEEGWWQADVAAAKKMAKRLAARAASENLGHWRALLHGRFRAKDLEPEILALMRTQIELPAPREPDGGRLGGDERRRLHDMGLTALHRDLDRAGGGGFSAAPTRPLPPAQGIYDLVLWAITDNENKLEAARPRSTHLAVYVRPSMDDPDPTNTWPPDLPAAIDVLWVLRTRAVFPPRDHPSEWWLERGATEWSWVYP